VTGTHLQVVAYNKMDVPDSSDYWEEVQEHLLGQGIPTENVLPISAATGQGVIDLVRRLRAVLDSLPPVVRAPPPLTPLLPKSLLVQDPPPPTNPQRCTYFPPSNVQNLKHPLSAESIL